MPGQWAGCNLSIKQTFYCGNESILYRRMLIECNFYCHLRRFIYSKTIHNTHNVPVILIYYQLQWILFTSRKPHCHSFYVWLINSSHSNARAGEPSQTHYCNVYSANSKLTNQIHFGKLVISLLPGFYTQFYQKLLAWLEIQPIREMHTVEMNIFI